MSDFCVICGSPRCVCPDFRGALQYAVNWLADIREHGHPQASVALSTIEAWTGVVPHPSYANTKTSPTEG